MASFTQGPRKTFYPNATGGVTVDFSQKQYYIAKLVANNTVDLASNAQTDFIVGTVNNVDRLGQELEVWMRNGSSTHKVILGGTVALGAYLTTNSTAQAIATVTAGDVVLGRAMQAGIAGDVIEYMPHSAKY